MLPDGRVSVLDREPDLLVGVDLSTRRMDQTAPLALGSTLLMFTDGLIERRGSSLEHGYTVLLAALTGVAEADAEELCDTLLARMAPEPGDDDIALIVVRAYPENRPRPTVARPDLLPPSSH